MGCECFRNIFKKNDVEEPTKNFLLEPKESQNSNIEDFYTFNFEKAKIIVEKCLSNDGDYDYYSRFKDTILSFNEKDFKNLFMGNIVYPQEILEITKRYNIYENENDREKFIHLNKKFQNFQMFLINWYKNEKYHEYLIQIWKQYPLMTSLKEIYTEEHRLENFLKTHGIDYSNWDSDIKESFINCIRQSPEIKSCQIEDYINNKFPEIKELYISHINYEKNLSNYYSSGMLISKINLEYIGKCLISEISELFFQNFDNTLNALIKGNSPLKESIEKRAAEIIYGNYYYEKDLNDENDSFINYRKVYELSNKLKDGKLLGYLEKVINVAFKTNLNLAGCINVSLGLLELITSVHELYKCFLETDDNLDNQFKNELNNIRYNFEIHRDIGLLPKNYDEALQKIADAIDNINKDRNDLIDLIYRIDKEISKKKIEKEKSLRKIIKNALFVGVSVTGAIFASGPGALAFVVSSAAYGVKTITQSKKFHKAKKKLKNYEETFREAIQFENKIELELEHLLKIYKNIKEQYLPADYKNQDLI